MKPQSPKLRFPSGALRPNLLKLALALNWALVGVRDFCYTAPTQAPGQSLSFLYHKKETIFFTIDPHYGNLKRIPKKKEPLNPKALNPKALNPRVH